MSKEPNKTLSPEASQVNRYSMAVPPVEALLETAQKAGQPSCTLCRVEWSVVQYINCTVEGRTVGFQGSKVLGTRERERGAARGSGGA